MDILSKRLKQLRQQNRQYQKELALYLDVSVTAVSSYESNVHDPDLKAIARIADFYGVTVDYLLGRTNCPCPIDDLNQMIASKYPLRQFMQLLTVLTEQEKSLLVHVFRLLEYRYQVSGKVRTTDQ